MLDEPSRGVDVGARFEIYSIIREMAGQETGILLVSSDFSELLGLSDRVLIIHRGEQINTVSSKGLDQETLLTYCYGRIENNAG